jgi:hypothetical protein
MKKLFYIGIFAFAGTLSAQSVERSVIGSLGSSFNGSIQADYTVGEVVVNTGSNGSVMLTQGFHQPPNAANAVKAIKVNGNLTVFPNPTNSVLNLVFKNQLFTGTAALYDATGRVVWSVNYNAFEKDTIDLSNFATGVYTLQLQENGKPANVIRITRL